MASLADPSRFVIGAAMGYVHILLAVLCFLERVVASTRDPVVLALVVLLALLTLVAYHRLAIAVFAVVVAGDGYRYRYRSSNVTGELEQAAVAALSPAAVLGWLGNLAIKLAFAVAFLIFGVVLYIVGNVMLAARN